MSILPKGMLAISLINPISQLKAKVSGADVVLNKPQRSVKQNSVFKGAQHFLEEVRRLSLG